MSSRRIRSTINNTYVQPLKLGTGRKLVISLCSNYNSVLFTKRHKPASARDFNITLWAKFNTDSFDGIQMISFLEKNDQSMSAADCSFDIYSLSTDNLWTETLRTTVTGSYSNGKFIASASQASLAPVDLDGEVTLAIKCTMQRQGKTFTKKIYLNHLGVYDSIFRLRKDVEFLDLTKVDE